MIALLLVALAMVGWWTAGNDFSAARPRSVNLRPFGMVREDRAPIAYRTAAAALVAADIALVWIAIVWAMAR